MDPHAAEIPIPAGAHRSLTSCDYTDGGVFAVEMERIFARSWQLVGHQTQLAAAGDYMTVEVAGENLLILRGDDGALRGFYNICLHRGHALAQGRGNKRSLICPYHAWRYDARGRVMSAPNAARVPGFSIAGLTLKPVALEVVHGLIFVNLDLDAQGLAQGLGPSHDEIGEYLPDLGACVFAHRTERVLRANWKVAVENYSECYHCAHAHKTFTEGVVTPDSYRIVPRGLSQLHCSVAQTDGKSYGYVPDAARKTDMFAAWLIWPLTAVQVYPGGVAMTFRWVPLGPEETRVEVDWWLREAEPTAMERELIDQHAETTFSEDAPLVESVQRNMRSRGFDTGYVLVDAGRGQLSEHGVKAFHDAYRAAMGRAS